VVRLPPLRAPLRVSQKCARESYSGGMITPSAAKKDTLLARVQLIECAMETA
jgi:hypothetical protein